jgi:hypothetical protein
LTECYRVAGRRPPDRRTRAQESDHRHRGLLRARHEWPRGRCAQQRNELTSSKVSGHCPLAPRSHHLMVGTVARSNEGLCEQDHARQRLFYLGSPLPVMGSFATDSAEAACRPIPAWPLGRLARKPDFRGWAGDKGRAGRVEHSWSWRNFPNTSPQSTGLHHQLSGAIAALTAR